MADLISSHASTDHMGYWLVLGSASNAWISNNSPSSLDLSGLTHGLSYLRLHRITQLDEKYVAPFTSWHVGDGIKNEYTYGDVDGLHTFLAKLGGTTIAAVYTEKARIKRFFKTQATLSHDRVYFFNRFASSAGGYETFYNDDVSDRKFAPVLIRDMTLGWTGNDNRKIVVRGTVEEIWRTE